MLETYLACSDESSRTFPESRSPLGSPGADMRRRYLTVFICGSRRRPPWSAPKAAPDESGTISSTTELVLVPVQVKGHNGLAV